MIQTQCSGCFREYQLNDKYAGKTIRCKDCGTAFKVLAAEDLAADVDFDEPAPQPRSPAPRPTTGRKSAGNRPKKSKSGSNAWVWWTVGGVGLAMVLLCCGGIGMFVINVRDAVEEASTPDVALGDPNEAFPLADVPLPQFPPLGEPTVLGPLGALVHSVDFGSIPGNDDGQPGQRMQMRVYLPPGEHEDGALACVLVAPAGTNLLSGVSLDGDDYHDETLPYAEVGMAVVFYSLDGSPTDAAGEPEEIREFYLQFREARAGVINGRNALDYVLAQMPQVDPQRIFSAGHSSAATLSLLLAAHEPRLRGCVAYAPATDIEARLGEVVENPIMGLAFPAIDEFVHQSSPKTHVSRINCPVFLFHARDDSNEPFATTEAFAGLLQTSGKTHTFSVVDTGDHYNSMIEAGIPRGIEWIQSLETESQ